MDSNTAQTCAKKSCSVVVGMVSSSHFDGRVQYLTGTGCDVLYGLFLELGIGPMITLCFESV